MVFEDLHWIDAETQALLDSLVESLPTARLLLLVNYRPEYQHRWGSKTYYTQLRLDPLPAESAAELLEALLGPDPGLAPLKQMLVKRGNSNKAMLWCTWLGWSCLPMPFTTLLWRVVVLTPNGFLEGERSLVADSTPMSFRSYASDHVTLQKVSALPSVQRLTWFTHGFLKAEQHDGRLVLSDLRMGSEPDYVFRYVVAEIDEKGNWRPIPVKRLHWAFEDRSRLGKIWQRIWNKPNPETSRIDG